jgi:hypothetical protein
MNDERRPSVTREEAVRVAENIILANILASKPHTYFQKWLTDHGIEVRDDGK